MLWKCPHTKGTTTDRHGIIDTKLNTVSLKDFRDVSTRCDTPRKYTWSHRLGHDIPSTRGTHPLIHDITSTHGTHSLILDIPSTCGTHPLTLNIPFYTPRMWNKSVIVPRCFNISVDMSSCRTRWRCDIVPENGALIERIRV